MIDSPAGRRRAAWLVALAASVAVQQTYAIVAVSMPNGALGFAIGFAVVVGTLLGVASRRSRPTWVAEAWRSR